MGTTGRDISFTILGVIALVIGLYLVPTIITAVGPTLSATTTANNAALVRSVLQFVPVGYVVGLLAVSFGLSIRTASMSGGSMQTRPALLIGAVITLVIGIALIPVVSTGVTTGTTAVSSSSASSSLALTSTVLGFVTIGYVVAILGAAFAIANVGSGGAIGRRVMGR